MTRKTWSDIEEGVVSHDPRALQWIAGKLILGVLASGSVWLLGAPPWVAAIVGFWAVRG